MAGKFIISLDFELHWGGVEKWPLSQKRKYFLDTRASIPSVLKLFEEYDIRATWATVGFLFAKDKAQLLAFAPEVKPSYANQRLSYYNYFDELGSDELSDPFHFAFSLIEMVLNTKGQEIGTHTFAHYYCNEQGQNIQQFQADLQAAQDIAKENFGLNLISLVFPRNQYNQSYLKVAGELGIKVVRSNPDVWFWRDTKGRFAPICRALDTLIPISKSLTFDGRELRNQGDLIELPASRFFRPYSKREQIVQSIKLNRILSEMTRAAKNGLNYHLWWHPHNFGEDVDANLGQLKVILSHFADLKMKYGFESLNMGDFAK